MQPKWGDKCHICVMLSLYTCHHGVMPPCNKRVTVLCGKDLYVTPITDKALHSCVYACQHAAVHTLSIMLMWEDSPVKLVWR